MDILLSAPQGVYGVVDERVMDFEGKCRIENGECKIGANAETPKRQKVKTVEGERGGGLDRFDYSVRIQSESA